MWGNASKSDSRRKQFDTAGTSIQRDDPALATTSRLAEPVDDTDRVTLSCAARHASTTESNCACARSPSVEPCPHPQSKYERRTRWLCLPVSPHAIDKPVPTMRAETNGHARAHSPWSPLFPKMTDRGATGTRSRPTPPSPTSASNARPRNPPVAPRTAGTVGAPPTSTIDATPPPTANAAAAPREVGPNTRPPLSIVGAAVTSTAGAAAMPTNVGTTWRQGPCPHPYAEQAPLPPSPPLLPPAGRTARSDNARDPPPATATLPPPSSMRASGDGEDAEDAEASCRNLRGDQLLLLVRANIRKAWGRLELTFPLDLGDPAGGAVAFRLVGLSAPEPMQLSTSRSTSSPPRQNSRVRTNAGMGGESNTVPAGGGTTAGTTATQHA